jgi:hypothetical protein
MYRVDARNSQFNAVFKFLQELQWQVLVRLCSVRAEEASFYSVPDPWIRNPELPPGAGAEITN